MRKEKRNYRRVWVRGHWKYLRSKGRNGKPIRKFIEGYWRKLKMAREDGK